MESDILNLLKFGTSYLNSSPSPRLDAEILLSFAISKNKVWIYSNFDIVIGDEIVEKYKMLLSKRKSGIPIPYITGKKEFMGLEFKITDKVLVPRVETEELVEKLVIDSKIYGWKNFLDFGTGSGVIAVSIAKLLPDAQIWMIDINEDAVKLAVENAEKHGVATRIHILKEIQGEFDIIVSNPPYLTEREWEDLKDLHFEPYEAFAGGEDGNNFYKEIMSKYKAKRFYFEIAHPLRKSLKDFFDNSKMKYEVIRDLSGRDRIVILGI